MSTLLDTNTLLRSTQLAHPLRQVAVDALATLRLQNEPLHLVPQNLYEYWVVCTRPVAQIGLGMAAAETEAEVAKYKRLFSIVDDIPAILPEWERLVTHHQILGKSAHDARLVAAMLVHRIPRLLTFNIQDFQRFPGIAVISPQDVLQSPPPSASGLQGPVP
jgi:predicted nucleic acid-binding protein